MALKLTQTATDHDQAWRIKPGQIRPPNWRLTLSRTTLWMTKRNLLLNAPSMLIRKRSSHQPVTICPSTSDNLSYNEECSLERPDGCCKPAWKNKNFFNHFSQHLVPLMVSAKHNKSCQQPWARMKTNHKRWLWNRQRLFLIKVRIPTTTMFQNRQRLSHSITMITINKQTWIHKPAPIQHPIWQQTLFITTCWQWQWPLTLVMIQLTLWYITISQCCTAYLSCLFLWKKYSRPISLDYPSKSPPSEWERRSAHWQPTRENCFQFFPWKGIHLLEVIWATQWSQILARLIRRASTV